MLQHGVQSEGIKLVNHWFYDRRGAGKSGSSTRRSSAGLHTPSASGEAVPPSVVTKATLPYSLTRPYGDAPREKTGSEVKFELRFVEPKTKHTEHEENGT